MIMKDLKKLVFKFVFWSPLPLWSEGSFLFPTNRKCFTFNANGLFQPGQESSELGVDPRVVMLGTAKAPADDSDLNVTSVPTPPPHSQRSPTVSFTGVNAFCLGTEHVLSNLVSFEFFGPASALFLGHRGHIPLLQNVGLMARAGETPPSHPGRVAIVVVLSRVAMNKALTSHPTHTFPLYKTVFTNLDLHVDSNKNIYSL